ncbi:hypothetical protein QE152_g5217 [Popillia japonica]|uniref:Uncharacterized protein n=1 Tax=Popillia japonica TaxID=7064 RepID=A0AAW1MJ89_POPJA
MPRVIPNSVPMLIQYGRYSACKCFDSFVLANIGNNCGQRSNLKNAKKEKALKQMQSIISEQAAYDSPEATTLEITSEEEDEVVTVDIAPKRKYRLSHRKSSDGNGNFFFKFYIVKNFNY